MRSQRARKQAPQHLLLAANEPAPALKEINVRPEEEQITVRGHAGKVNVTEQIHPRRIGNAYRAVADRFGVGDFKRLNPLAGRNVTVFF